MNARAYLRSVRQNVHLRILRGRVVLRSHPLRTALAGGLLVLVSAAFGGRYLVKHAPIWLSRISHPIFQSMQLHPQLEHLMHVLFNAVPDVAFSLLALAGLGYLMPKTIAKLEDQKGTRVFLVALFVLLGLSAILVNAVNRADQERQQWTQSQAQAKVLSSVLDIQQSLHSNKTMTEAQRRESISESLRDEYILTQNPIDPEILAGAKMPPQAWMNQRLHDLGETWTVSKETSKAGGSVVPRSYITFNGTPIFTGSNPANPEAEGSQFQVGDALGFNIDYKVSGPNQVEMFGIVKAVYIEPNSDSETQQAMLVKFTEELNKEEKVIHPDFSTKSPGDMGFVTAYVFTGTPQRPVVTQGDLEKLRVGTEVAYVISEITYKDRGTTHHQRECVWLQPPAAPPGIWHFCEVFNKSD